MAAPGGIASVSAQPVLLTPRGRYNDPDWILKRFTEHRKLAGLRKGSIHSLRHTCASWLAEQGVDLKVIQEIMRHGQLKQTERYAHLIPEVKAR